VNSQQQGLFSKRDHSDGLCHSFKQCRLGTPACALAALNLEELACAAAHAFVHVPWLVISTSTLVGHVAMVSP